MGSIEDNNSSLDFKLKHIQRKSEQLTTRLSVFELVLADFKAKLESTKRDNIQTSLPISAIKNLDDKINIPGTTSQLLLIHQIKVIEDVIDECHREQRRLTESLRVYLDINSGTQTQDGRRTLPVKI